ncbi:hypothetical protein C1O66_07025 [Paucibacter aquatile]|uniref:Uncharacterized protein n=1 Tax=Kinneretia aquatilis TaxID=2070761 RepID=A0A2N8KV20_9BURK|nr:hypothetical protein [Paucibacter aquatile]PND37307.1 hypothetical protein C1O66_07025 [Paucibacter aquatile]
MDFAQMQETWLAMAADRRALWWQGAAGFALAALLPLLLELLYFRRQAKAGSWLKLRLLSLLMAPLCFAVVWLPARAVSGPMALGVFYLLLLTVGPGLWFGSHAWLGRRLRPPMSWLESLVMAVLGLVLLFGLPLMAAQMAEMEMAKEARQLSASPRQAPDESLLPHRVLPPKLYRMPGVGLVWTQSLIAPEGLRLLSIDQRVAGPWYPSAGVSHPQFCMQGGDLHLMWSSQEPTPQLRLHWRDAYGQNHKASHFPATRPTAEGSEAEEFRIGFRPRGLDPSAPIPRSRVYLSVILEAGLEPYMRALSQNDPEDPQDSDCILPGYQRPKIGHEGDIVQVGLTFQAPSGQPWPRADFRR